MQIAVTFRHMESSDALRQYLEEKLSRVKKYIDEPVEAQTVFSVHKKNRHCAEVILQAKGITIKGTEETEDMYAAIDGVVDKLEKQLKKYKEKLKKHKPLSGGEKKVQKQILQAESVDEGHPEPQIVRSDSFEVKPMSTEEAVMQMDLLAKNFLVFTDVKTGNISIVYRRDDGNYGLMVPEEE